MERINQSTASVPNQRAENFEEAYFFEERIFQLFGVYNGTRKWDVFTPFIFFYKWFNLLMPVAYIICALNSMENNDVHKIFEFMIGTSASINSTVKMLTYNSNRNEIMQLKRMAIDDLNKYTRSGSSMENGYAVKYLKIMNLTSKYLTIIYISAGITFITSPMIFYIFDLPREEWMQPITVRIFFTDRKSHPGYELNFLLSVYIINILCVLLAAADLTFMHLCFYVFIQLTICKNYCLKIGETSSGNSPRERYAHLCRCIILFKKICMFVKDIARIFIFPIFSQCITSILIITSCISYLKYSVFNSNGLLASNLVELFGFCWIGQMILNMSNEMSESVYASNWNPHLNDPKMSRAFLFFLEQTQTENELSAFGLVQLSFATLTRVMKASFSYVAFLQNVTN